MDNPEKESKQGLPAPTEKVRLGKPIGRSILGIFAFLICSALLVAAFAVSGVWSDRDGELLGKLGISFQKKSGNAESETTDPGSGTRSDGSAGESITDPEMTNSPESETAPSGAVAVISRNLAASPEEGIRNETPYSLDPAMVDGEPWRLESKPDPAEPVVLILHTHAQEAYLTGECAWLDGSLGDATYSTDPARNVTKVGAALCDRLNALGIPTIQSVENSSDDYSLQGAYSRSAERITALRERYPSIRLVIDLHRDAVLDGEGNYIRSLCAGSEQPVAQVMAVVGTDGNGTTHESWRENLALATALRDALNRETSGICRPTSLRNASYNQELSPHALLLEIGTGGNTVEEAIRAADVVGEALAGLLLPSDS